MRSITAATLFLLAVQGEAFQGSSFAGTQMRNVVSNSNTMSMEYIPSGVSKEQWKKMKAEEAAKKNKRNLGRTGITTFKSRSFEDWQKSGGKKLVSRRSKNCERSKGSPIYA